MTACNNSRSVAYHEIWHCEILGKFVDMLQISVNPANSKGQVLHMKTFIPFWAHRELNLLIFLKSEKRLERLSTLRYRFYLNLLLMASG